MTFHSQSQAARLPFAVAFCLSLLFSVGLSWAQTSVAATTVPHLIRFGGVAHDLNGNPLTGTVGVTFSLYSEQSGGAALWIEAQNVQPDASGHYSVLLGVTKPDGLPADLFTAEQARWVGVQIEGQAEQPRTLLASAPLCVESGRRGNSGRLAGIGVCAGSAGGGGGK